MKNKLLFCGIGLLSSCLTSSAYADEPLSRDELTIWVSEHKGYTGMVKVAAKFEHDTGYRINVEHFDSLPQSFRKEPHAAADRKFWYGRMTATVNGQNSDFLKKSSLLKKNLKNSMTSPGMP